MSTRRRPVRPASGGKRGPDCSAGLGGGGTLRLADPRGRAGGPVGVLAGRCGWPCAHTQAQGTHWPWFWSLPGPHAARSGGTPAAAFPSPLDRGTRAGQQCEGRGPESRGWPGPTMSRLAMSRPAPLSGSGMTFAETARGEARLVNNPPTSASAPSPQPQPERGGSWGRRVGQVSPGAAAGRRPRFPWGEGAGDLHVLGVL